MDFEELIRIRQSCRSFDPARPVEDEKLMKCVRAAKMAPSAVNEQPYNIWVVREKAKELAQAKGFNRFLDDCSVFVVFTDVPYQGTKVQTVADAAAIDFRTQDVGESIAYFTLQAAELGLSTCIIGAFDRDIAHKVLGTADHIQIILAVGYAEEGYPIREKKRKSIEENVKFI